MLIIFVKTIVNTSNNKSLAIKYCHSITETLLYCCIADTNNNTVTAVEKYCHLPIPIPILSTILPVYYIQQCEFIHSHLLCESKKGATLTMAVLCQFLIDLQNSFTAAKSTKFATIVISLPSHLKYVAALPWEI